MKFLAPCMYRAEIITGYDKVSSLTSCFRDPFGSFKAHCNNFKSPEYITHKVSS